MDMYKKVALFVLICFVAKSCQKNYEAGSRAKCEKCNSDEDCQSGLICKGFYNKDGIYELCAEPGTTKCDL